MALATPLAARIISFCHLNGFLLQGLQCPGSLRLEGTFSQNAGVAQWLERHVANVNVVGSNPITRFCLPVYALGFAQHVVSETLPRFHAAYFLP